MTAAQEQVWECCDRCATCESRARLVTERPALIECSNPRCSNSVERPDVEQASAAWNVKQRRAKG